MRKILLIFLLSINVIFGQDTNCFDVARKGNLSDIKSLFEKDKTIINAIDDKGSSMLILACYRGNDAVANFLIENNCDLNYVSDNGTALMAAVVKGNYELVKLLIKNGANLNLTDANGLTALMYAVQFNNIELLKLLLQHNADKNQVDKNGKTAFEYAVFSGNEEIINLLK